MIHDWFEDEDFTEDITFSEFIRKKRRLMGLCQADFAALLGYSCKTISKWETGVTFPTLDIAEDIIKVLGGKICFVNVLRVGRFQKESHVFPNNIKYIDEA